MSIWVDAHKKNLGIEIRKENLGEVFMARLDEVKNLEDAIKLYEDAEEAGFEDERFKILLVEAMHFYKWKMLIDNLSTCETKEDFEEFVKDMSENGLWEDGIKREFRKRYMKVVGEKYNKRIVNKK